MLHIDDVMHKGDDIPRVACDAPLRNALLTMTAKGLGMTAVVDEDDRLCGVFTDGDLRRLLDKGADILQLRIDEVMTRNCKTIQAGVLAAEALKLMQDHKINGLLVTDTERRLLGALNMHDLLRAGVM